MSRTTWCVGGWAGLTAIGLLTGLWAPAALAGLVLLPLPFLLAARRGTPFDPFEPIWALAALFAFAYLLVPPLQTLDPDSFISLPGYLELPALQLQFAVVISGLAFMALLWGYFGPLGAWAGRRAPALRSEPGDLRTGLLALALFAFGVAALVVAVRVSGVGLSASAISSGDLRQGVVSSFGGRGYLSIGLGALALSVPVAVLWFARRPGARRAAIVVLGMVVAVVLLAFVAGSRLLALQVPVTAAVVAHYRWRRIPTAPILVGGIVIAVLGVVFLQLRTGVSFLSPLRALGGLSQTLDGFNFLVTGLARTDDFLFGESILEDVAYTYFPRAIWADKPLIYGMFEVQDIIVPGLSRNVGGPNVATFPVGLVAEGYANFGVFGALALPALAGALCRAVRERATPAAPIFVVVLAWLIPSHLSLMRGFGGTLPSVAVTLLLLSPLALRASPAGDPET